MKEGAHARHFLRPAPALLDPIERRERGEDGGEGSEQGRREREERDAVEVAQEGEIFLVPGC